MYLILLGAPGAGKGTQASILAEELGLPHVATGDLFREALSQETELGRAVKGYVERGELVPDATTIRVVEERLQQPDCAEGVILDGFPRTLEQARALDDALAARGKRVDKVLYLEVSEAELLNRLGGRWLCRSCQAPYHASNHPPQVAGRCDACGGELYQRPDDSIETARNRLEIYRRQSAPLIAHYGRAGKLVTVPGEGGIPEVSRALAAAAKNLVPA